MASNVEVTLAMMARDEASKAISGVMGTLEGLSGKSAAVGKAMAGGLVVGAGALAGAGVAVTKLGVDFDNAYATIRAGTGATGETLAGLKDDFKAVLADVPTDFETASATVADLNTRLGLTGKPLQDMSAQIINMQNLGFDASVENISRMLGDWSISAEDSAGALDTLFNASQATGPSVDRLSGLVVSFGAKLRNFGFSLEESATLLGKWEKEGVNTELVMGSLGMAAGKFAKEGIDLREGLDATIKSIQEAGSSSEATAIAMETFGAKAGADMADAVRGGKFEIDDLLKTIQSGEGIASAAEGAKTFGQRWQEAGNQVRLLFEPIATAASSALGNLMENAGPLLDAFKEGFGEAFGSGAGLDIESFADAIRSIDFASFADHAKRAGEIVGEVMGFLSDHKETVVRVGLVVASLGAAFAALAPVLMVVGPVVSGLGTVFGLIAPTLGLLASGVGIVMTAVGALVPILGGVAAVLTGPVGLSIAVVIAAFALWKAKGDEIQAALAAFGDAVAGIFEAMSAAVGAVLSALVTAIGDAWTEATEAVSGALEAIGSAIRLGWDAFLRDISDKLDAILGAVTDAWDATREAVATALDVIGESVSTGWQAIQDAVAAALGFIGDIIATAWGAYRDAVAGAMQLIANVIDAAWGAIKDAVSAALGLLFDVVRGVFDTLLDFIDRSVNGWLGLIERVVGLIPGRVGEKLSGLVATVRERFEAVLTFFREFGGRAITAVESIGRDIVQGLLDGINWGIDLIRGAIENIGSLIPQWLRDLLDSRSPSMVMFEIGQDITAGLTLGVADGEADLVKQMQETIRGLVDVIKAGVDAILSLASLEGKTLDTSALDAVRAAVERLSETFGEEGGLLDTFVRLGDGGEATAAGARSFADTVKALADVVSAVLGLSEDLADGVLDLAGVSDRVSGALLELQRLFGGPDGIFASFNALPDLGEATATAARNFADTVAALVAVIKSTEVGEVEAGLVVNLDEVERVLVLLRDDLTPRLAAIVSAWGLTNEAADALGERVQAFTGLMGAVVSAMKVSEVGTVLPSIVVLTAQVERVLILLRDVLTPKLLAIVSAWGMTNEAADKLAERVQAFTGLMGAVVGAIKASEVGVVLPSMVVLTAGVERVLKSARDVLFPMLREIVNAWNMGNEEAKALAERVQAFTGYFSAVVGALKALDGLAEIKSVEPVAPEVLAAMLDRVRAFALGIRGFAAEIDTAAAAAVASLGPAVESFSSLSAFFDTLVESPFFSASRRVGSASSSTEFRNSRTLTTLRARIVAAVQEMVAAAKDAMAGVSFPADLATKFDPLKSAAEALASAMEALRDISVPSNLREIMVAASLFAALGGVGGGGGGVGGGVGGPGGGGGSGGAITIPNVTADTATIAQVGLTITTTLDGREIATGVLDVIQRDIGAQDRLIDVLDRRRAQRGP